MGRDLIASLGTAYLQVRGDLSHFNKQLVANLHPSRLGKLGKGAGLAVGAGLGVGLAGVTAGKALFGIGKQFDDQFDKIRVGTGQTGKSLEGLEDDFKTVLKSGPDSMDAVGTAVTEVNRRLGLTGKPLQRFSRQLVTLSRVTDTDLAGNIESVARAFEDWDVPIKRQSEALDGLFRLGQKSGISVSKLADSVQKFGSPLRILGFSLGEAAATFATFERAGVNTQTMVPGLKLAIANLIKPSKDLEASMKELGISAGKPEEGLKKVFALLGNKSNLTNAEKTSLAMEVFGKRAGADMAEAVRQGRFEVDAMMKAFRSGDTINKAGRDTEDFTEKWQRLKNAITVGLEPIASRFFDSISKDMEKVGKILSDPKLSTSEKWDRIGDVLSSRLESGINLAADVAAKLAPKVAGAFVRGFVNAPALVQLLAGAWIFAKGRAIITALGLLGAQGGAAFGAGVGAGAAGGAGAGAAAGGLAGLAGLATKLKPLVKRAGWVGVGVLAADSILGAMKDRLGEKSPDLKKRLDSLADTDLGEDVKHRLSSPTALIPGVGGPRKEVEDTKRLKAILDQVANSHRGITAEAAIEATQLAKNLDLTRQQRREVQRVLDIGRQKGAEGGALGGIGAQLKEAGRLTPGLINNISAQLEDLPRKTRPKFAQAVVDWAKELKKDGQLKGNLRLLVNTIEAEVTGVGQISLRGPSRLRQRMAAGFEAMVGAVADPTSRMAQIVQTYLEAFGAAGVGKISGAIARDKATRSKGHRGGLARGGFLGGAGRKDTIPIMAAPGEAVLNRHQQRPVEKALRQTYGYGLGDLFQKEKRPHYFARGGFVAGRKRREDEGQASPPSTKQEEGSPGGIRSRASDRLGIAQIGESSSIESIRRAYSQTETKRKLSSVVERVSRSVLGSERHDRRSVARGAVDHVLSSTRPVALKGQHSLGTKIKHLLVSQDARPLSVNLPAGRDGRDGDAIAQRPQPSDAVSSSRSTFDQPKLPATKFITQRVLNRLGVSPIPAARYEDGAHGGNLAAVDSPLRALAASVTPNPLSGVQAFARGGAIPRGRPGKAGAQGIVPIPGQPGESIHSSILNDVLALIRRYKLKVTDGYAPSGHAAGGEHPKGLAIDAVPGGGGSWNLVDKLAKWAEPKQGSPRSPFRWVGYTGDSGHGRGNHLHLSWGGGEAGVGGAGMDIPKLGRIKITGRSGAIKDLAQAATSKVRSAAQSFLDKQVSADAPVGTSTDPGGGGAAANKRLARSMMKGMFGAGEFGALNQLWQGESGWDENAVNPSSGAGGIPQALPASKMGEGWQGNARQQIAWGLKYIKGRYGSPSAALAAWKGRSPHWYAQGGFVEDLQEMYAGGSVQAAKKDTGGAKKPPKGLKPPPKGKSKKKGEKHKPVKPRPPFQIEGLEFLRTALDRTIPGLQDEIESLDSVFSSTDEDFYPDERTIARLKRDGHNIQTFTDKGSKSFVDWSQVEQRKSELSQLLSKSFGLIGSPFGAPLGFMEKIRDSLGPALDRVSKLVTALKTQVDSMRDQVRRNRTAIVNHEKEIAKLDKDIKGKREDRGHLDDKIKTERGKKKPNKDKIEKWRDERGDIQDELDTLNTKRESRQDSLNTYRYNQRHLTGKSDPTEEVDSITGGVLGKLHDRFTKAKTAKEDLTGDTDSLVGISGTGGTFAGQKSTTQGYLNELGTLSTDRIMESVTPIGPTEDETKQDQRNFLAAIGDLFKNFGPNFRPIKRQRGGMIPGFGFGDKVPALLEPGEGLINKRAVVGLGGPPAIERINRAMPRFQTGGVVSPIEPKGVGILSREDVHRIEIAVQKQQQERPDRPNVTQNITFQTQPKDAHTFTKSALFELEASI